MALRASSGLSIAMLSIVATVWVSAVPIVQAGADTLRRNFYGPDGSETFYETFLDDHDTKKPRNEDGLGDDRTRRVRPSSWLGQARGDIDFPPILLVDMNEPSIPSRSTGLLPNDRALLARFVKRNYDEIDRTPFDNFFKRNIDEIDRVGWNGFAKRFTDYLTNADRMNVLKRHG